MAKDMDGNDTLLASESGESSGISNEGGHKRRHRRRRISSDNNNTDSGDDVSVGLTSDNDKRERKVGTRSTRKNSQPSNLSWEVASFLYSATRGFRSWRMVDTSRMRHRRDHTKGQNGQQNNQPESFAMNSNDDDEFDDKKHYKSPLMRKIVAYRLSWARARLILIFLAILSVLSFQTTLFGKRGSIKGGLLGRVIDTTIRTYTFRQTLKKRNDKLAQLGYHLPKITQENVNKRGLPVMTQSYLAETLLGSAERKRKRTNAERQSDTTTKCKVVPPFILQPNSGIWYRPFRVSGEFEILEFQESEMRSFMKNYFPSLPDNDVQIWGLCALYWYGGYFVSSKIRSSDVLMMELLPTVNKNSNSCEDSASLVVHGDVFKVMKATPRHPSILCAIRKLQDSSESSILSVDISLFGVNATDGASSGQWFDRTCLEEGRQCCQLKVSSSESGAVFLQQSSHRDQKVSQTEIPSNVQQHKAYSVQERKGNAAQMKKRKRRISSKLAEDSCEAGWLCNRCLKTSWFGSFSACYYVCRSCYVSTICEEPDDPKRNVVHIDLVSDNSRPSTSGHTVSGRIPRVIHQTWFEDVTVEKYPHLVRIQNSWKKSGWEYRFYNDESARAYIRKHFPPRFLDAFDALIPGAFKADLFRLLILMREGGIYVDADVKLDIDLDVFVTDNLEFFAPVDFIGGYADGEYCFWNGFIGAEPGHPFIVKAVERMLNVVLNRYDYYDVERETCRASHEVGGTEIWKLRALDILTLTGPCALGISVNGALGRQNLVHTFDTGWFHEMVDDRNLDNVGDVLFLTPDKYDLGEFRFSDVGRNLLVASTEHTMSIKKPLLKPEEQVTVKAHYSSSEHLSEIYGEYGVYVDNSVTNEIYAIQIKKNDNAAT